jgi:hypothetical protein
MATDPDTLTLVDTEFLLEQGDSEILVEMQFEVLEAVELGASGPPGPAGSGGGEGGSTRYEHTQSTPASTWTVNHNLGRPVAVTVLSTGGKQLLAEVFHASGNQVLVYLDAPLAGRVICS